MTYSSIRRKGSARTSNCLQRTRLVLSEQCFYHWHACVFLSGNIKFVNRGPKHNFPPEGWQISSASAAAAAAKEHNQTDKYASIFSDPGPSDCGRPSTEYTRNSIRKSNFPFVSPTSSRNTAIQHIPLEGPFRISKCKASDRQDGTVI